MKLRTIEGILPALPPHLLHTAYPLISTDNSLCQYGGKLYIRVAA